MLKRENTERLLKKMEECGVTVPECAREIGLSRQSLYQKINGERDFKCAEMGALCTILKIDVSPEFKAIFFG